MEAATQHILDMSQQFEDLGKFDQMFDDEQENLLF